MISITLNFQPVVEGLPPVSPYTSAYSRECAVLVKGTMFDRAVMYRYSENGWVWADQGLGYAAADYRDELGGDCTPTHWALWPTSLPIESTDI